MIGFLLVAHSRALAEGVRDLMRQVAPLVPVEVAAGAEDPAQPLGTNPVAILEALQSLLQRNDVEAVVVFMDLGSAVLSAETALDFLDEEARKRVYLSPAPLVEGAVTAATLAAAGVPLHEILREAQQAVKVKGDLPAPRVAAEGETLPGGEGMAVAARGAEVERPLSPPDAEVHLVLPNPLGLHARPAARFVQLVNRFSGVQVWMANETRGIGPVPAWSLNQVLALGIRQGHRVYLQAWGPQAQEALRALKDFLLELKEAPPPVPKARPEAPGPRVVSSPEEGTVYVGVAIAPGVALGPAYVHRPRLPQVPLAPARDPEAERRRFEDARQHALAELNALYQETRTRLGPEHAEIFLAHRLILEDPAFVQAVGYRIQNQRRNAARAVYETVEELASRLEALDDPLLQARAQDIRDVGARLLRALLGVVLEEVLPPEPAILIAEEVQPSDVLQWKRENVLGLATVKGGPTTHAAILARGMGIPAVAGLDERILSVADGTLVGLDGQAGKVWVRPTPQVQARLRAQMEARRARWTEARAHAHEPAITRDGVRIRVQANVRDAAEARKAAALGAEGSGLVRTEFLFVEREQPPSEEEQIAAYREIFAALAPHPVTIRTADIGGDKPIPYLELHEDNPFLGLRGLRLSLAYPEMFRTQLRALLRAAVGYRVNIMLPMVALVEEWRQALAHFRAVQEALQAEGVDFNAETPLGIMVEIPAVVFMLEHFIEAGVAFFSLGTNDLTQYTLAADRTHPQVALMADALHPAVLHLIHRTVQTGRKKGVPVGICGELAGDPQALPILVGLGLRRLSMVPDAIPEAKARLRGLAISEAEALARKALTLPDARSVRRLVGEHLEV